MYDNLKSTSRQHIIDAVLLANGVESADNERLIKRKTELFNECRLLVTENDFTKGAIEYIEALKRSGKKTAIASSSHNASYFIEKFGIARLFDVVLDAHFDCPQKPSPEIYYHCMRFLGLNKDECIIFEDSPAGVLAANTAGVDVVYVGKGECKTAVKTIEDFVGCEL
jgi:beta-phosphoglucomutase